MLVLMANVERGEKADKNNKLQLKSVYLGLIFFGLMNEFHKYRRVLFRHYLTRKGEFPNSTIHTVTLACFP